MHHDPETNRFVFEPHELMDMRHVLTFPDPALSVEVGQVSWPVDEADMLLTGAVFARNNLMTPTENGLVLGREFRILILSGVIKELLPFVSTETKEDLKASLLPGEIVG